MTVTATRLTAGCFGKNPGYGDFVRFNAARPELESLDRWIASGIRLSRTKSSDGSFGMGDAAPWHFVYQAAPATSLLVGVMAPSRDSTGRQYPLFLYVVVPAGTEWADHLAAVLCLTGVRARFVAMSQEAGEGVDHHALTRRLHQLAVLDVPNVADVWRCGRQWLSDTRMAEWWAGVFDDRDTNERYRLYAGLCRFVQAARAQPSPWSAAVRFPLYGRQDADYDVAWWLLLVNRLAEQADSPLSAFWQRVPRGRASLLACWGKVPSRAALGLFRADAEDEAWLDLTISASADAERQRQDMRSDRRALLERDDLTLKDFLEQAK
jgi:type VI secretion system protein ImpM